MTTADALVDRFRDEVRAWGHLPAAMRLKQGLVEAVGVAAAHPVARAAIALPHSQRLRLRPVAPLSQAGRATQDFVPLWPARGPFERPPLHVIGAPPPGPLAGVGRAGWLSCLQEVVVRSRSAYVMAGEVALLDAEPEEYAGARDLAAFDPAILHGEAGSVWAFEHDGDVPVVEEGFHLLARNAVDFGHWLTDYLPRYVMARLGGLPRSVPLLMDPGVPAAVLGALADLAPDTPVLRLPHFEQRRVRKLWVAPSPIFGAFYPEQFDDGLWSRIGAEPRAMARLMRAWQGLMGPSLHKPTARPRVMFARKPGNLRKRLVNHAEVEAIAIAHGFERIYPEDLPFAEQVRIAHHAEAMLAPEGSNAMLSWFGRPGARVALLSPQYTLPLVDTGAVLAELGMTLSVLCGTDEARADDGFGRFWNDYRMDLDLLASFLSEWAP